MLAVALSPTTTSASSITAKLAGIVLANLSSGAGEVNFLALTHYYGSYSLAAWGSGTGGAGLIGAGAYSIATIQLHVTPHAALLTSALLPVVMVLSFFLLLPRGPLMTARRKELEYQASSTEDGDDDDSGTRETAGLLEQNDSRSISRLTAKSTGTHSSEP